MGCKISVFPGRERISLPCSLPISSRLGMEQFLRNGGDLRDPRICVHINIYIYMYTNHHGILGASPITDYRGNVLDNSYVGLRA